MSTINEPTKAVYRLPRTDPHLELEEIRLELGRMENGTQVVLDISEISLLDSILLGQILRTCLYCQDRNLNFSLTGVNNHARWVIHNANLDTVFGLPKFEPPRWESDITAF